MDKFCDDYHRMNTPSENKRAQEHWDAFDRQQLGPDYKRINEVHYPLCNEPKDSMIGGRLDIRGQEAESGAEGSQKPTSDSDSSDDSSSSGSSSSSGKTKKSKKKSKNKSKKDRKARKVLQVLDRWRKEALSKKSKSTSKEK